VRARHQAGPLPPAAPRPCRSAGRRPRRAAHIQRIATVDNPRTHDALVAEHGEITRWAMTLAWPIFERRLQDWLDEHDADGAEPDDARKRKVNLSQTIAGVWVLTGTLDAIGGSIVARELRRLDELLFREDWAEAKQRLDREPLAHELIRSGPQRRADALRLMAERSATLPDDGRKGQALFIVLVGDESFRRVCELTNGIQVRPAQLAPELDDALYETIVYDGPFRAVKASRQRNDTGVLRRAILAMYRGCVDPMCDAPIDDCEIDHHNPVANGGRTTQANGRPRCGGSNREKGSRPPPPDDLSWIEPDDL
jgi:hypothetical protein